MESLPHLRTRTAKATPYAADTWWHAMAVVAESENQQASEWSEGRCKLIPANYGVHFPRLTRGQVPFASTWFIFGLVS